MAKLNGMIRFFLRYVEYFLLTYISAVSFRLVSSQIKIIIYCM